MSGDSPVDPGSLQLQLKFAWDHSKAASNVVKHGVTFTQAATVLLDPLAVTVFDGDHSDFEERWFTLGITPDGKLLAVSHTYTATSIDEVDVRIISVRPATRSERQHYEAGPS